MDQIGGKIGYYRTVRIIRKYFLSRVRTKRVPLYLYSMTEPIYSESKHATNRPNWC